MDIVERRLVNQGISGAVGRTPAEVVAWHGAVQAQEYAPARWGLGLRLPDGVTDLDVARAFDRGEILRTHVMRPTWHFVTPNDIRWMLELTAPRVHRRMSIYNQHLALDARTLTRGTAMIERALRDGRQLIRAELGDRLRRSGLTMTGTRLAHLALFAELEGVICSGPRRAKQFTYALLAERVPQARRLPRDEALAELCRRLFRSHGPATVRDFVWWSGLTTLDATRAVEMNRLRREDAGGRTYWSAGTARADRRRDHLVHLLPIYDEYLVAYRDRHAVPHGPGLIAPGADQPVIFRHAIVIAGQIAGTWRTSQRSGGVSIEATVLRPLSRLERRALDGATERYQRFLAAPVSLSLGSR